MNAEDQTFMKERPVMPLLLSMSIPMIISMLSSSLYNIVDGIFISQISPDAMTALSLVFPMQNVITAVGVGFGVGINAVIAKALGAGEHDRAEKAAMQGCVLCLLHGILLIAGCEVLLKGFLRMYTDDPDILQYGIRYGRIVFAFALIFNMTVAMEKIFQAVGKMKLVMCSMLMGCGVNILLDPVMIFGWGPFPEMGITGAAVATGIGETIPLVIYLLAYRFCPTGICLKRKNIRINADIAGKMYYVGVPAIMNMFLPSIMISALNAILAPFSAVYVLVLGIYYKLQSLLSQTANGVIQGMRPITSYNYGAKEYRRVGQIYGCALFVIVCIMAAGTICCLAMPRQLMLLFDADYQTAEIGERALRIICAGFVVSGVSITSCGALEALGRGIPSFVISLLRYVAVILPAALVFSHLFGAEGVWHAFWIAEAVTGFISWRIFSHVMHSIRV